MANSVYLIYNNEETKNKISSDIYIDKAFYSPDLILTTEIIETMAKKSLTDFFIVIRSELPIYIKAEILNFTPPVWDSEYTHIWNNDPIIMLFNKNSVLNNPSMYNTYALHNGQIRLKLLPEISFSYSEFDIVFLSHGEPSADDNYKSLKRRFQRIKRVDNVDGFLEAHRSAAMIASTFMFYVVDADSYVLPTFEFNFVPNSYNLNSIHIWNSRNPINDLEYGYGGIKLFPTKLLLEYNGSPIDFTTSIGNLITVDKVSNITRFNTSPFNTWRSAFRECTKLSSKIIKDQVDKETEYRLNVWCTVGMDREFGEFAIDGAIAGKSFGEENRDNPEKLRLINNYVWLKEIFSNTYPGFLLPED